MRVFILGPEGIQHRRLLTEIKRLKELEHEGQFMLHPYPPNYTGKNDIPPRFNNTDVSKEITRDTCCVLRGRIFPYKYPYSLGSFLIEIRLPTEFPFKRPDIVILDPIYHPNIGINGRHCEFCCCWGRHHDVWKPTSTEK